MISSSSWSKPKPKAMTTASVIIQASYREGNLLPVGSTPTTAELAAALERLNRFVRGLYGNEMGENLQDWLAPTPQRTAPVAANYPQAPFNTDLPAQVYPYPPKNSRIVFGGEADLRVYFPEAPDDGSRMGIIFTPRAGAGVTVTLDGNGRSIEAAPTKVMTVPTEHRRWMYRADLGDWRALAELALTDELPFPEDMDDLTICGLAIRLAPGYDKTISAETASTYKTMLSKFRARYRQHQVTTFGAENAPNSWQSYGPRWGWAI